MCQGTRSYVILHNINYQPFRRGSLTNSLFLVMLNLEEFCRLSFFTCGGPENFILLMAVAGGWFSEFGDVPFFFAYNKMSMCVRKPTMWLPNMSDTNRAVQAQKMARG